MKKIGCGSYDPFRYPVPLFVWDTTVLFQNLRAVLKQRPAVFIRLPTGCSINFYSVIK
jgi:hypothetical protein